MIYGFLNLIAWKLGIKKVIYHMTQSKLLNTIVKVKKFYSFCYYENKNFFKDTFQSFLFLSREK